MRLVSMSALSALGLLAGCFRAAGPESASAESAKVHLVRRFASEFGRANGASLARLFADTAVVKIEDLSVQFAGRQGIMRLAEYASTVHSQMRLVDWKMEADVVDATLQESNDWFRMLGVDTVVYKARFVVPRTRIVSANINPTGASQGELAPKLARFLVWLATTEPQALGRLLPGGKLAPGQTDFRELLDLLKRWNSGSR